MLGSIRVGSSDPDARRVSGLAVCWRCSSACRGTRASRETGRVARAWRASRAVRQEAKPPRAEAPKEGRLDVSEFFAQPG